MSIWGGISRVGTVLLFNKKQSFGNVKLVKGDIAVASKHTGDWHFKWLLLKRDSDLRLVVVAEHSDYFLAGDHKELGKITQGSLISLQHEWINHRYGEGFLAISTTK